MRRFTFAMLAATFITVSVTAQEHASGHAVTHQQLDVVAAASPVTMSALFEVAGDAIVSNGMTFVPAMNNVLVARKNDDGSITTACVNSERAMRTFLERKQRDEAPRTAEK